MSWLLIQKSLWWIDSVQGSIMRSCPLVRFVLLEVIITTSGVFKMARYLFLTLLLQTNEKCTSGVYLLYKIFNLWSCFNCNRTLGLLSYFVHATSFDYKWGKNIINFNKLTININTELFALTVFNSRNRTSSLKVTCLFVSLRRSHCSWFTEWKKKQLMRVKKLLIGGVCL